MNKFIIASCIIALTFGWTANPTDYCSCSDYNLQAECNSANGYGCSWNAGTTSTCQKVNCSAPSTTCLLYPSACYVNTTAGNNTCLTFSSCTSLKGASDAACQAQNGQCVQPTANANDTTACAAFKCSLYTSTNCPATCFVNGSSCSEFSTCTGLSAASCTNLPNTCYLNGTTCQAAVCANFGADSCTYVKTSATNLQPCSWNATGTACINAPETANLTATTCFNNTLGAYHWSSASPTDGSCKSCYGVLLQIVFAIILLLA